MNEVLAKAEPPADDDELELRLARYPCTDLGNVSRLLARRGRDMMYVHGVGWYRWDGRRWIVDRKGFYAQLYAQETARAIAREVAAVLRTPEDEFGGEAGKKRLVKDLRAWNESSENSGKIKALVAEAAPYLHRTVDQLDAHPYLLNVRNGTLELGGGEVKMRRHKREDLITRLADVDYDPAASAWTFGAFLDAIMPEAAKQTFLQRYYGYSLTGDIREQKLLLAHGSGANGKSTLANALRAVYGDYAVTLPFESFAVNEHKRGGEATPDLAEIPGKRLIFLMEPENNVRLSPAMIKRYTVDEPLRARNLNEGFMEFRLQAKLSIAFNDLPIIPGHDDGTWRRPMLLGFDACIPPDRRDARLGEKLAAEASGILNWLLDGYRRWHEIGLSPPESVTRATQDYRLSNDNLAMFLAERVERCEGESVPAAELYAAYKKWCDSNGIAKPMTNTKFGTVLPQRGYAKRTSGSVRYVDLRIRPDPATIVNDYNDMDD
ncbi:DNA primase family protein [Paludisphaera rhizosphaerae]|uniref:DNA primase family protein n=1 Tax=Paludisphaera rhizosphaerae TaxID=2711216 RepID=UPI0013EA7118|nr:phage/plasmid primase, P4 family [Paludisphaera rhizosphaerae]